MTPLQWRDMTIGHSYEMDGAYPYMCWDYYAYFVKFFNLPISTTCSITGYVCDLWRLKDQYGYSTYFEYITDPSKLQIGDWVIWDKGSSHSSSHIAMFMSSNGGPVELGQNQGYPYVTEKPTTWDMLGAFRFRSWGSISIGCSDMEINGHSYSLYRQGGNEIAVVLSAGINKVASIRELDADVYVMAKITGANYFQMKQDQPDPYGTTYGDLSAPLNDVWTEVPNQNTSLYFDIETGSYGDCTGIHVDMQHNVFSPGIVYPKEGNYQYAPMPGIGIGAVNIVSRYTFLIRFKDGTYAVGIANQDLTPKQIAADIKVAASDLESISFLDGGGSAQMGRWNGKAFEYVRDTGREVPSAVAIVSTTPIHEQEQEIPAESDDSHESEEETMPEEKPQEQEEMKPVEGWTDPEPQTNVIVQRIAALLSVKSIITIALTVVFGYLVINQLSIPDFFTDIYKIVILFFFGYQTGKAEQKNGKQ